MKIFHIIACLLLICSCSFFSTEKKRDVMSAPQQLDTTYMSELSAEQPQLWNMIKSVIDTINYYRYQMKIMPENAVGYLWNRFWNSDSLISSSQCSHSSHTSSFDPISEYQTDTFRIGWLNRCMRQYNFSAAEKIVLGDCKINLCRYLEKKYLRMMCLRKFDMLDNNWSPYHSSTWNSFYASSGKEAQR